MAKRGTLEHPKFARLKMRLRLNKAATLGYLETLWQFVGRFTPQGNIGKYSDADIEAWLEWDGEPGELVAVLVECGWIDRDEKHRLIIHDWADHVDHTTRTSLKRQGLEPITRDNTDRAVLEQSESGMRTDSDDVRTVLSPPEPEPEPEPSNPPLFPPNENSNDNLTKEPDWWTVHDDALVREVVSTVMTVPKFAQHGAPKRELIERLVTDLRAMSPSVEAIQFELATWQVYNAEQPKRGGEKDAVRALRNWFAKKRGPWALEIRRYGRTAADSGSTEPASVAHILEDSVMVLIDGAAVSMPRSRAEAQGLELYDPLKDRPRPTSGYVQHGRMNGECDPIKANAIKRQVEELRKEVGA